MSENTISPQASQIIEESQEIRRKKYEIDKTRIESNHTEMIRRKTEMEVNNNIDLSSMSSQRLTKIIKETREYLEHARNSKCFINDDFQGKVPFFGRNLVLVAARTGHGKTTIGKNIAYHTLVQNGRVLYITNEENSGDVYNGVACLCKGWPYTEHNSFTNEQLEEFDKMAPILAKRMVVIDDNYNGGYGQTTSLEGIKAILLKLHETDVKYDVIIIDYYQNISHSNERPDLKDWQVQEDIAKFLDTFKNTYLAPIIALAQLKEGKDLPFKEAIEGRKLILNVSTCALEVKAEREFKRTSFCVHKTRFTSAIGETIHVGFNKGMYVNYTPAFRNEAELEKERKDQSSLLSRVLGGKKND
jgi:replicative DNA helicase